MRSTSRAVLSDVCDNRPMTAGSIRARVRAEMVDEIKAVARRHLAADGANLPLRAVARDMGMVSSALYRYFASRDDLLTALILDAYNALGRRPNARTRRSPTGPTWPAAGSRWLLGCGNGRWTSRTSTR